MLAHFALLGAFFSLLAASGARLELFLLMLVLFFGFLVTLDSILRGLGQVLELSKIHFSMFFGASQHTSQKCSSCNKTTVFAMFYRLLDITAELPNVLFAWLSRLYWTWCTDCCKKSLLAFTFCFSKPPCSAAVRAQHIRRLPKGCRACQIQGTSA